MKLPLNVATKIEDYLCNEILGQDRISQEDAEYIVKACNLYPELVEALDGLLKDIGGGKKKCGHDFTCVCAGDKAKEVLKKAKEDI